MQKFILASLLLLLSNFAHAFDSEAKHAILMDYETKAILYEKEANIRMVPSSMSKIMTAYIAFESLKSGHVNLDDTFTISNKAWKMGGTRMFIPLDTPVRFEDLLKGLIIQSGNDAAVAIAEILMGSEEEFAEYMNKTAEKLGMSNSNFTNASGWPDENNYSTAYDLAILSYHTIKDFPEYYHYYAEKEFTYNGIKQDNRNGLLYKNMGADGIKTGHTDDGGYGLSASIKKGDRRLIAVVNGLKNHKERTTAAERIMNYGIINFSSIKLAEANQVIEIIPVGNGKEETLELISPDNVSIILTKSESRSIKTSLRYKTPAIAPIKAGDQLGELIVETDRYGVQIYPLVAKSAVDKAGLFGRVKNNIINIFK